MSNAKHHTKGTNVNPTEQHSKTPRSVTGLFALLAAFLCIAGSGASVLPATAGAYATLEGPPQFSAAPGLPDGRVYELVSPANKNGNQAGASTDAEAATGAANRYGYSTADGNSVLFEGNGPMGESVSPTNVEFVATHTDGGWVTRALEPAEITEGRIGETLGSSPSYLDPSSDLTHAVVQPGIGTEAGPSAVCGLDLVGPDPSLFATWLQQPEISDPIRLCGTQLSGTPVGGTPDFSTVYFTYGGTLLPEDSPRAVDDGTIGVDDIPEAWGFYEYRESVLYEAGVLPDGDLDPFGAVPAASGHGRNPAANEVSADGSRAFFVSPDPNSCAVNGEGGQNDCTIDPPELYVHEQGEERAVLVSRDTLLPEVGGLSASAPSGVYKMPNPTEGGATHFNGSYVFASPDGSQAFFQSTSALTQAAAEASAGVEPKTYDFDVETGALSYLPGVEGQIVAVDKEGSSLAFVRPVSGSAPAELDLWSRGPDGGTVTPVTQLPEPGATVSEGRMSNDGSVLVFETASQLSSSFNSGGQKEVYRYDAATNMLGCVSCAPAGVTPSGAASISSLEPSETYEADTAATSGVVDSRGISANGDRVFFDTPDPLVPQDTNTNAPEVEVTSGTLGKQGRDVYEWENGVVYLISGGKSLRDSYYLGNSENGGDAFFATAEGLVPQDTDGGFDVYDARVPHPGDNPPAAAVPCEGAVCQGPPNVPAPLTPPASATFTGLGNSAPEVTPPPAKATTKTVKCAKGKKLSHGKCVKVKSKKKKAKAKKASHKGRTKS